MSACREIRELLGGQALGALEPDEARAVQAHLAGCADCARELGELGEAAALLDLVEPADLPLAGPSPELEETLLDRHAWERHLKPALPRPRRRRTLALGAGLAAAAAVIAAIVIATGGGHGPQTAYAGVKLSAGRGAPVTGLAKLRSVDEGTAVDFYARGLSRSSGASYTLWCVRDDGKWISAGSFHPDRQGRARASLTAAVRRGEYGRILVTRDARESAARRLPTVLTGAVYKQ